MNQCIGSCSICGGEVHGHVGAWFATIPPPPAQCVSCGATQVRGPVIQMVPRPVGIPGPSGFHVSTGGGLGIYNNSGVGRP